LTNFLHEIGVEFIELLIFCDVGDEVHILCLIPAAGGILDGPNLFDVIDVDWEIVALVVLLFFIGSDCFLFAVDGKTAVLWGCLFGFAFQTEGALLRLREEFVPDELQHNIYKVGGLDAQVGQSQRV
jgi:hypothetical protein